MIERRCRRNAVRDGGMKESLYSPPALRLPSGRQSKTQEKGRQQKDGTAHLEECHGAVLGNRYVDPIH